MNVDSNVCSIEDSIRGLDETVELLRATIGWAERQQKIRKELRVQPTNGILLQGPPGCGKTLLVRAVAKEFKASLHVILASSIFDAHTGRSEEQLREAFDAARKEAAQGKHVILFFDEVDALCPRRQSNQEHEVRVVAQMLTLIDGAIQHSDLDGRLIIIAATNRPAALDPALRRAGRIDCEISIPLPNHRAREDILRFHAASMPLSSHVNFAEIAGTANGYSGSDLAALCREAGMLAILRDQDFSTGNSTTESRQKESCNAISQEDFKDAMAAMRPSINRSNITEFQPVLWESIGGLAEVKQRLRQAVVWPLKHKAAFERLGLSAPRGVLIHGPPGCCKTSLVKAAITDSGAALQAFTAAQLYSSLVGEGEATLRDAFSKAKAASPAVIFLDEIDALAGNRDAEGDEDRSSKQILSSLLTEMDGLELAEGVMVLAATNRPQAIDTALLRPGRFDVHIKVPRPDQEERLEILKIHSKRFHLGSDVDLKDISQKTEGYSGADLENLCREAAIATLQSAPQRDGGHQRERLVSDCHFRAALSSIQLSLE